MNNNSITSTAKDLVLSWVRSKNPQTMQLKKGCRIRVNYGEKTIVEDFDDFAWLLKNKNGDKIGVLNPNQKINIEFTEDAEILGSDMGLQELLIALCSLGAHSEIGDWKAQGTINRVLAFYNEGGKALFNYDLGQNLHKQHPNFYEYVLPLIS